MTATADSPRVTAAGKYFRLGGGKFLLKGVTYGPFAGADGLPEPGRWARDLELVRLLGVNVLRLYTAPPAAFLDACQAAGLRVLAGVAWTQHVDFLRSRKQRREIEDIVRQAVRTTAGHPALLGWLVGNEIESTLVRWLGARKVQRFLERLINAGREEDPGALFSYATYPTTEWLVPDNADFCAWNVYLEDEHACTAYLARLQNLAGNKPLLVSEFGLDSLKHGEERQAETLSWAWEACLRAGAAGQVFFAFTDEWFTAGADQRGWDFGLTTRARRPKQAYVSLSSWLPSLTRPGQGVRLARTPSISVIVCTHNGSHTLQDALASLELLVYPDFEVILVDDGSTDRTPEIAADFRDVKYIRIDHAGLSAARNRGAEEARGEILAYTDDDCQVDEDWLTYLALAFERERTGMAGGPNIPPPARTLAQACIARTPGGPAHVLVSDTEAEHVPGCNMAVLRDVWKEVGGFREEYWAAGDDVDFCWRVMDHGYRIAFHAGAMVWHYRRFTVRAFLNQQKGYGKAEALLIERHRHRFGRLGGARWRGSIYEPSRRSLTRADGIIYGGQFGTAPFQAMYALAEGEFPHLITSLHWLAAALVLLVAGWWAHPLAWMGGIMLAFTGWAAARKALEARLEARYETPAGHLLLWFLVLAQPVLRGWSRLRGCLRHGVHPTGPWLSGPILPRLRRGPGKAVSELAFWSAHSRDRDQLLSAVLDECRQHHWPVIAGEQWDTWDFQIQRSPWWILRGTTVTEYHPGDQRLTRLRLTSHATRFNLLLSLTFLFSFATLGFFAGKYALWLLGLSFVYWLGLEFHHGTLATQVLRLVTRTARELGLRPLAAEAQPQHHEPEPPPEISA